MRRSIVIGLAAGAIAAAAIGFLSIRRLGQCSSSFGPVDLDLVPPRPPGSGPVEPEKLHELLRSGDALTVTDGYEDAVLYRSQSREDVLSLSAALLVTEPKQAFHCMCDGSPAIHVLKAQREILSITIHHGTAIRASIWQSDAPLSDSEPLLRWFDSRGIPGPRREVEEEKARYQADKRALDRWLAAVPGTLSEEKEAVFPSDGHPSDAESSAMLRSKLAKGEPSPIRQVRLLFRWYGSGAGPWSGFPSYEQVPENLLLTYPTATLVAVAEATDLSEQELEGAARLFGGWAFWKARPEDLTGLPAPLKARLLQHSLRSDNDDKRARAEHAFGAVTKAKGAV
jgi:hypothetical protein